MTRAEPLRVSDNRRVEDADKYRMSARDRQAGFFVQLLVRPACQRHSQIEVVRPSTERWACPHRNHDAEDQRSTLHADYGRSVEMAAGTRRGERQRFYLSADARGTVNDTLQHWAKVAGITKHISFHYVKYCYLTLQYPTNIVILADKNA